MENASKALIIAGAVLIAILVASLIVYLAVSGGNVLISSTNNEPTEIKTFNSKFTKYEGEISGIDVKQLLKDVNAINSNTSDYIELDPKGKTKSNQIRANEKYIVILEYSKDTGKVNKIKIE